VLTKILQDKGLVHSYMNPDMHKRKTRSSNHKDKDVDEATYTNGIEEENGEHD